MNIKDIINTEKGDKLFWFGAILVIKSHYSFKDKLEKIKFCKAVKALHKHTKAIVFNNEVLYNAKLLEIGNTHLLKYVEAKLATLGFK